MFIPKYVINIFTKKEINYFILIFFGIFFTNILDVISFATIVPVFNAVFLGKNPQIPFFHYSNFQLTNDLKLFFLFFFVIFFYFKNLLIIIFNFFYIRFLKNINIRIKRDLFFYFLHQDYFFFLKNSENFFQKINYDSVLVNEFLIYLINLIIEIVFLLLISCLLINVNYKIFFFCFISFSIVLFVYYKLFQEKIKKWSYIHRDSIGSLQKLTSEGIQGYKDIILYDLQNFLINKFNHRVENSATAISKINLLNNIQKYWLELVGFSVLTFALIYFVIVGFDINKLIPVFGLFILVIFRFLTSVNKIVNCSHILKFNLPSIVAVANEFNNAKNSKINIVKFEQKLLFSKSIIFQNVNFFYSSKKMIFNDLNFEINKGDSVVIFGNNGSGKTSFLNLIAGLIKPTKGQIVCDNLFDVYSSKEKWFRNISYVQQNIFLMDATIKDNIVLTPENAVDVDKFNKVSNMLNLNEFFINLQDLLSTKVGVNGINISGGQKQIISLARALYKDSEILILDEPTSALDSKMTLIFKNLLLSLKGKKTIIMVTHDKSFFNYFDIVYEINSGRIQKFK